MWPFFVSIRYLTARQKERFISVISLISILGISVGVAALIIVLSIMTGFDEEIKEKIIGAYAHIIILSDDDIENPDVVIAEIKKEKDVTGASAFLERQAILKADKKVMGILLRGIDGKNESEASNMKIFTGKRSLDFGPDGSFAIIGSELMKNLGLREGMKVGILSPQNMKQKEFTVIDSFTSGRYDYDANIILIDLNTAKALFNTKGVTGIGVKVRDEYNLIKTRKNLQGKLGYPFMARTWMDLDKNLMKALAMEKKMMFIILGLIVLVACFNISGSLIMMVMEKTKDIGILRALGATAGGVGSVFLINGFITGFIGTAAGAFFGAVISKNINQIAKTIEHFTGYQFFPNDIYYLSEIPAKMQAGDIMTIMLYSLILATLSGIYPALHAAKQDPIEAIRYE